MSETSSRDGGREDRERVWVGEILEASRARLDLLYEVHAPHVYRMALQCTANEAEAERVTEAVFVTVLRDLASWADGGPSVLLAIFGAVRHELNEVGGPFAELTGRRACDEPVAPSDRGAEASMPLATQRASVQESATRRVPSGWLRTR